MARRVIVGLILVAVVAVGAAMYWRHEKQQAELRAGLDAARVLSATFGRTNQLKVAELNGEVIAPSQTPILMGTAQARQVTRAPYSVSYFVDLSGVNAQAMRWDQQSRTLSVTLPDVVVATPAVDLSRAQVRQEGLWISRTTGQALQRQGAARLGAKAQEKARSPENIEKARAAAVSAVGNNVRAPLQAAGLGDVTVNVRIAGLQAPPQSEEQWDLSRSIEEVYRDFVD